MFRLKVQKNKAAISISFSISYNNFMWNYIESTNYIKLGLLDFPVWKIILIIAYLITDILKVTF